jgi:hypothetical protein
MLISSALVLLMVPGAALFYSGATERRSTLSMIWLPVMTTTVIGLQVSLEHLDNIVDNSAENHLQVVFMGLLSNIFFIVHPVLGRSRWYCTSQRPPEASRQSFGSSNTRTALRLVSRHVCLLHVSFEGPLSSSLTIKLTQANNYQCITRKRCRCSKVTTGYFPRFHRYMEHLRIRSNSTMDVES